MHNTTVASLGVGLTKVLEATVSAPVQSRLIAHASVNVETNGSAANLYCFITDDLMGIGANDWSIRTSDDIPAGITQLNTGLVGAKVVAVGSHTVYVLCGKALGTVSFVAGDLSLIAVAT